MLNFRTRAITVVCLVTVLTCVSWNFLLDDALIYYRYMRNALDGLGLVYNAGEHINALTSPLYTYLLLLASWLFHGHIHFAAAILFGMSLCGCCLLAENAFPYSGMFLASMSYFYSLIGMETSVLLLLIALALTLYTSGRVNWLPLILVLVVLTRAEAGALVPVFAYRMYRDRKWPALRAYLPALFLMGAYLFSNHALYHAYLPQSSMAKVGQGRSGYWGKWPRAFLHAGTIQSYSRGALFTLPFLIVAGLLGIRGLRGALWNTLILPSAAIMLAFYVLFNIPNYHWYYAPFLFWLALYATVPMTRSKLAEGCLLALIAMQAFMAIRFLRTPELRIQEYRALANWLNENTATWATVEACEIGELGWATPRKVIDVLGLTNPKNANHIAHRDVTSWIAEDKPDYIVVHRLPIAFELVAVGSPDYEKAPVATANTLLLRRKGVVDRSNQHAPVSAR